MQKFRDVLSRRDRGDLSMFEAGELLGMSERQFRRYRDRYAQEGEVGRLGRVSERIRQASRLLKHAARVQTAFAAPHCRTCRPSGDHCS
jgi:hypothetical protein